MGWTVRFDIQHLLGNRPISREIHTSVQNRLVYMSVHMPATTVSMHFTLRAFVYEKIAVEMAKRAGSKQRALLTSLRMRGSRFRCIFGQNNSFSSNIF